MPDAYISQFSGEEIDSTLRAAQIISGADTPAAVREKLEIYGSNTALSPTDPTPVTTALKYRSNPNLLDNWFFGRPVNQRGASGEIANWSYSIDRWLGFDFSLAISTSGLTFAFKSDASYCSIMQRLEKDTFDENTLMTVSYIANGTLSYATGTFKSGFAAHGDNNRLECLISDNNKYLCQFYLDAPATILAVKLELGSTQTLAHEEGDRWVLNEIPDFGEQLRRCQRYCVDVTPSLVFNSMYGGTLYSAGCDFLVPIPVTLRESGSTPVVICNPSEWQVAVVAANAYFTPTSISVSQIASGAVALRCLFSHSLSGQYCDLRKAVASAKLILSADL